MKQLAKSLVIAGALAVAGSAVADFGDINPYIGADLSATRMKAAGPYSSIAPKSFPGASLYVGAKFHENFGLEAGYNWTKTKSTTVNIPANFDGARVAPYSTVQNGANVKLRRNSSFVDVVGFLPVMDCVELTGSVGYGYVMPKLSMKTAAGAAITGYDLKNQSVVRLGLGANYMVTDMVGVRAKLGWESTGATQFKKTQNHQNVMAASGAQTKRPLKDSTSLNIGAFVKF
ncbi:MAG: outer membrane beta-barrel protein [Gammaproteobacteria bacterium]|nr:outer membrane beta-barrel protein [Gammaproteobacteria bacterium]MBP9729171.1 outer membrane beta-barrel protein [Gammaproteobacteria bacterium]